MDSIHDLIDLLIYHIDALHAAEEQVEQAMPSMLEQVSHQSVKNALAHHAGLTAGQKERLSKARSIITEKRKNAAVPGDGTSFGGSNKGIAGLLDEARDLLGLEISKEVKDAAIIAAVQKIEHYEICAYGTAIAFATQLQLHRVIQLLNETLQEEYDADDLLTALATAAINKEGVPEGSVELTPEPEGFTGSPDEDDTDIEHTEAEESERTINSPGGRAGTSHRGYGTGESRGH